ncbi:LOW QUALITY PROTEIN: G-protein coupled receptor Mth2-like [Nylanderia fulva]|uniref:LOW QUALITY PROTEIN: G-protein coupled receptor Mth2-like n=1 Tax=Nylanderia fulva TaxID=613905 RepID=UPI0010FB86C6|nr:LOW QUALITY PROTEIN: G-protein coupled receptor Mth2-like [Nylanderia fulva]
MCQQNFGFLCCTLFLLIISSSKSQQNFTNNEEKGDNLTVRNEEDTDSTTNYNDEMIILRRDLHKKLMNNTQNDIEFYSNDNHEDNDLIQYKRYKHSMQNKYDGQKPMKSNTNSTNVNHKRNFTPQEFYENVIEKNDSMSLEVFKNSSKDANETVIVPNEMCHNDTCIRLCCSLGDCLVDGNCIPVEFEYTFPKVYTNDLTQSEKRVNESFDLAIYDSCQEDYNLLPKRFQYDYKIFTNGSIYLPYYEIFVESSSYCLAVVDGSEFQVIYCSKTYDKIKKKADNEYNIQIIYLSFYIVSILLLGSVFLVYSILPELRNVHGFMLRNYSGALIVAYSIYIVIIIATADIPYSVCVTIAFLNYFCYMASFFWLSIMSFDMWCTFRKLCSLQRNVRQRKRKLIYYTIFAWGCSFMLAIFCVSMDFLSKYVNVPPIWTDTFVLYFYGPKSVCIISSVCLSISTAQKIKRYKKDTIVRLTDSESKRYNDNKKRFNLYLKLFIMLFVAMGINWSVRTLSLLVGDIYIYVEFTIHLVDIVQNLCTFIVFICKKKIKLMLLKRFGCGLHVRQTTVTSSTTTSEVTMQDKNSYAQDNCHVKSSPSGTEL